MRGRLALEEGDAARTAEDVDAELAETLASPDVTTTALVRERLPMGGLFR